MSNDPPLVDTQTIHLHCMNEKVLATIENELKHIKTAQGRISARLDEENQMATTCSELIDVITIERTSTITRLEQSIQDLRTDNEVRDQAMADKIAKLKESSDKLRGVWATILAIGTLVGISATILKILGQI